MPRVSPEPARSLGSPPSPHRRGSRRRWERVANYDQLLRIEQELDDAARFAGAGAFLRFTT
jgi:enolase